MDIPGAAGQDLGGSAPEHALEPREVLLDLRYRYCSAPISSRKSM
ncbi:hypothetical protein WME91_46820 [Sorangium sp. So ce269]